MNISVDESIYTFAENASTVEVCLATSNKIVYHSNICFNIGTLPESSLAKGIMVMQSVSNVYIFLYHIGGEDFTSSVSSVTLRDGESTVCLNLTLNPDSLVEGDENHYLIFTNNNPDIILNKGFENNRLNTSIQIEDSTGMRPMSLYFMLY